MHYATVIYCIFIMHTQPKMNIYQTPAVVLMSALNHRLAMVNLWNNQLLYCELSGRNTFHVAILYVFQSSIRSYDYWRFMQPLPKVTTCWQLMCVPLPHIAGLNYSRARCIVATPWESIAGNEYECTRLYSSSGQNCIYFFQLKIGASAIPLHSPHSLCYWIFI